MVLTDLNWRGKAGLASEQRDWAWIVPEAEAGLFPAVGPHMPIPAPEGALKAC